MKRTFTPRNTKAVFFDMNNTLIDPGASFDSCFLNVLVDFAGRWDDGDGQWEPRHVLETYKTEWNKKKGRLTTPEELEKAKKQCLETALRHYPFQVNEAFTASFFREMRNQMREHAVPFPHARDTVAKLSEHYKIGIITNGRKEHQEKVLGKLSLSAYVAGDRIFASNHGGVRKPNPAIFLAAVRSMSIRASEGVMVGDSWKNDVTGALKSGMNAVWLNRPGGTNQSRRKVGKLEVPVVGGFKELGELFGS
ncbi:HAD family hydrolase [Paenibacillus mesophilus]|uniref:HAD family hydrolase n=1 Tax=Paenibacillus mesophilus TaxID=2582849 RepID=UPI00110E56BF|nr:HAD family hydrolase [Paenibacillus mesophilus]TMV48327.1 HAD family hydrolase [Paenibacillus mesophilus]